ncbi:hypothetical protein ACFOW0_01900 [Citroniella saccharovorans]
MYIQGVQVRKISNLIEKLCCKTSSKSLTYQYP